MSSKQAKTQLQEAMLSRLNSLTLCYRTKERTLHPVPSIHAHQNFFLSVSNTNGQLHPYFFKILSSTRNWGRQLLIEHDFSHNNKNIPESLSWSIRSANHNCKPKCCKNRRRRLRECVVSGTLCKDCLYLGHDLTRYLYCFLRLEQLLNPSGRCPQKSFATTVSGWHMEIGPGTSKVTI